MADKEEKEKKKDELSEALEDAEDTLVGGVIGGVAGLAAGALAEGGGAAVAGPMGVAGAVAGMAAAEVVSEGGELSDALDEEAEAEHQAEIMEAAQEIHAENSDLTGPEAIEQAEEELDQDY